MPIGERFFADRQRGLKCGECLAVLATWRAGIAKVLERACCRKVIRGQCALADVEYTSPQLLRGLVHSQRTSHGCQTSKYRRDFRVVLTLASLQIQQP